MKTQLTAIIVFLFTFSVNVRAQFFQQGSKLVNSALAVDGRQGTSVDISADGNTAIVGVPYDGVTGGALIYVRNNGSWTQQGTKLSGSDYKLGQFIGLSQGISVAISGDGNTVAIGDPNDNDFLGAVYIFTRSNGTWTQQGNKLSASGLTGVSGQGNSVDLSQDATPWFLELH